MMNGTRRDFLKTAGIAAAGISTAVASTRAFGANERIRLGVIGTGNRGGQLIEAALNHQDMEIVALCDVYQPYLDKWTEKLGGSPQRFKDFRQLLEQPDIDAVMIATPDHWHAIQTIMACDAGKDVYVEKPLAITIHEGRKMVEAARRNNRIVQMGAQRRSCPNCMETIQKIREGIIGKVTVARSYRITNVWPNGIGKASDAKPPEELDWDMWLGPRPERPYLDTIAPYKFRWWKAYSSQLANWSVHYMDVIRWALDDKAPAYTAALGGNFAVDDDRDIPDTLEVTWQMPSGALAVFGQYETSGTPALKRGFTEFRGTKGTLYIDDRGYEIVPERGGQFQDNTPRMEAVEVQRDKGDATIPHIRNFLDCVKSRELPTGDVETGHYSTNFAHLGNIALATQSIVQWEAEVEQAVNNEAANALLHYEYRQPWTLG